MFMHRSQANSTVKEAKGQGDLVMAQGLFREYAASLPQSAQISLRHQGFEAEMAGLPGRYARPTGCILLGFRGVEGLGVVALREITRMAGDPGRVCEMKRMYVSPRARRLGLGRMLAERLIEEARAMGYSMMKLDTEPDFAPAIALYQSLGFVEIPRYNDDPVSCTLFMGRAL